ncbi:MAG TPA: NAD(P)-dependent oxidoreductase, partial [Candidatus Micrarchaeota archaeon]|nr:NAD(P)-dependent oxidoreductase [Candidatus Micrarchaeota archaeon]
GVKKFIYASSIAAYGKNIAGKMVDESFPASPTTDYGFSKLSGEKAALEFAGIMKIAILRLGLVYGGGIDFGYYKMLEYIQRGKMKIVGDGENRLPFVHANDVAEAFMLACEKNNYDSGSIFNICGELKTQNECIGIACRELGAPVPSKHVDFGMASALAALNKALACTTGLGNCKKAAESEEFLWVIASDRRIIGRAARDILGFTAKIALADGIAEVARAYLKVTKATK